MYYYWQILEIGYICMHVCICADWLSGKLHKKLIDNDFSLPTLAQLHSGYFCIVQLLYSQFWNQYFNFVRIRAFCAKCKLSCGLLASVGMDWFTTDANSCIHSTSYFCTQNTFENIVQCQNSFKRTVPYARYVYLYTTPALKIIHNIPAYLGPVVQLPKACHYLSICRFLASDWCTTSSQWYLIFYARLLGGYARFDGCLLYTSLPYIYKCSM